MESAMPVPVKHVAHGSGCHGFAPYEKVEGGGVGCHIRVWLCAGISAGALPGRMALQSRIMPAMPFVLGMPRALPLQIGTMLESIESGEAARGTAREFEAGHPFFDAKH